MSPQFHLTGTAVRITTTDSPAIVAHAGTRRYPTATRGYEARSIFARLAVFVTIVCAAATASAGCRDDVPLAHLIGEGPFCIFGFCLYDAQLWAARAPQTFDDSFALLLTYRRTIKAQRLVDAGIGEIERLARSPLPAATLDAWRSEMARAFRDVAPGDELCGEFLPGRGARFYANGKLTAQVDDQAFARAFFRIWLDPATRAPRLRQSLLALNP